MFRVSYFLKELESPGSQRPPGIPPGPVVIWNLLRRCNLACKHCYATSADVDFAGELSTPEIMAVLDDLKAFRVPALILSGGEPLMHPDIEPISRRAVQLGFYTALSSNGTLIDDANVRTLADIGFHYLGISVDGIGGTHDRFRRMTGAFDRSMRALELCKQYGIKTGLRFTLTQDNAAEFDDVLRLMDEYDVDKFYLSHLNYAGRGDRNRKDDVFHQTTRHAIERLFDKAQADIRAGRPREYTTGNNDADGVFMYLWARERFPDRAEHLRQRLEAWGGNATGLYIGNIDNLGNVHPDSFWWDYTLGNVRERPFSAIWSDRSDPLFGGLAQRPRPVEGRCGACPFLKVCGGNTRVRAYRLTGNPWAEDPACYLDNETLGIASDAPRLANSPYRRASRAIESST